MKILGIILIVAGIIALAYQGITYTKRRDTVQVGPIGITAEPSFAIETVTVLPPLESGTWTTRVIA